MRRSALALIALVFAVGLAACGGEEEASPEPETTTGTITTTDTETTDETTTGEEPAGGDPVAGKEVFLGTSGCGACHTLADAGTSGTIGPNLDDSQPSSDARGGPRDERRRRYAALLGLPLRRGHRERRRLRVDGGRRLGRADLSRLSFVIDLKVGPRRSRGLSRRARAQGRGGGVRRVARGGRAVARAHPRGRRPPVADEAQGQALAGGARRPPAGQDRPQVCRGGARGGGGRP